MIELLLGGAGALVTVIALALWVRLDVLRRLEFDGEILVRPRRLERDYAMVPTEQAKEDFYAMSKRLEREERENGQS